MGGGDDDLVLYTAPNSRGSIARWMLEEVGRPYRVEAVGLGEGLAAPAFRAINPMGKVPALVHGGTVVTETAAVVAYLADAFPEAGLAPPSGSPLRGPYYRWLFFAAGPLEMALTDRALRREMPEGFSRASGYGDYARALDALEGAIAGGHLVGDRFGAADLYAGSHLAWGMMFGTVERRPAFEAYVARQQERPAARRVKAMDEAASAAA